MAGFFIEETLKEFEDFENFREDDPKFNQIDFCNIEEDHYRLFLDKFVKLDLGKGEIRQGKYLGSNYAQREIVLGPYVSAISEYVGKNAGFTNLSYSQGPLILSKSSFMSIEEISEDDIFWTLRDNDRSKSDFILAIQKDNFDQGKSPRNHKIR